MPKYIDNVPIIPVNVARDTRTEPIPAHLARIGLCSVEKMTELQEAQRLFKPQAAERVDEELFVKQPKFNAQALVKRRPASKKRQKKELAKDDKSDVKDGIVQQIKNQMTNKLVETRQKGLQLQNMLRQSMAHRWLCLEFMESHIDNPLLTARFNMEDFLRQWTKLQTRVLPRRGWQLLRRHMGKPRRFSAAFILQERFELERQRCVLRFLQSCKIHGKELPAELLQQLPVEVPMPLKADTKVSIYLPNTRGGLRNGFVISYEPENNSYGVRFEIEGKPTVLKIPDMCLHVERPCNNTDFSDNKGMPDEQFERMLYNGIYSRFLLMSILQLEQLLSAKRDCVQQISKINLEFEGKDKLRRQVKTQSQREKLQSRYVNNMVELHRINSEIMEPLNLVHRFVRLYDWEEKEGEELDSNMLYQKCCMLAELDLKAANVATRLKSGNIRQLLLNLQTLMYIYSELGQKSSRSAESLLDDYVADMLNRLPVQLGIHFDHMIKSVLNPLRQQILSFTKHIKEELKPEPQLQMQPEFKPEIKPEIKPEMKPEMKPEIKPEIKPEQQPEKQPEEQPVAPPILTGQLLEQLQAQVEAHLRSQMQNENMQPEMQSTLHEQMELDAQEQLKERIQAELQLQFESKLQSEPQFDMRCVAELQINPDNELHSDVKFDPDMLPLQADLQLSSELQSDMQFDADMQLEPELQFQAPSEVPYQTRPNLQYDQPSDLHLQRVPDQEYESDSDFGSDILLFEDL